MTPSILIKNTCEATQLRVYVKDKIDGDPLWSSRYNATHPEAVEQIYLDFLEAGADVLVTNTYQASVEGFMEHLGLSREESIELIKKCVRLVQNARKKFLEKQGRSADDKGSLLIAASIGPYGAYLHDGSDYTGEYDAKITGDFLKNWHKSRISAVIDAGVDALAIETIPCQMEAKALAELLCSDYPKQKFWFSLQCKDSSHLASGESFAETVFMIWNIFKSKNIEKNCLGIGINCLNPLFVTPLLESVNGNKTPDQFIPLVAYPNSGEAYDTNEGWIESGKLPIVEDHAPRWIELGIKVMGGCCRTNIKDIPKYKAIVSKYATNGNGQ